MQEIKVDFEVFKELTYRRKNEQMTENDVIRELLKLETSPENNKNEIEGIPLVTKGVSFPHGTKFRTTYKGQQYDANVENGSLILNGFQYSSLSAAAFSITGSGVNGWRFWECLKPESNKWKLASNFRK